MDLDLLREMVDKWSQELLQNEQQLSVIGRVAVLTFAALLGSALTWFSTRLGWACLKGAGRGLRRLWPRRTGDPLVEELCTAIEASLASMPQPQTQERKKLLFTRGDIDLETGLIRLGGENITGLFSARQYRRLWRLAKQFGRELQAAADQKHKRGLLVKVLPAPAEEVPCCPGQSMCEGPFPGEACGQSPLQARMTDAFAKAGWNPHDTIFG